jgi:hypothetical protein
VTQGYTNDGTTGTANGLIAKLNGNDQAVKVGTSDTEALGIVVSGGATSGTAQVAVSGTAACTFDNTSTAGHYVQIATGTAGDCHDAGAALPTSGGTIIGRVADGGAAGLHNVAIALTPPGGSGGGSPAGSTNDVEINSSGSFGADSGHNFLWDLTNHRLMVSGTVGTGHQAAIQVGNNSNLGTFGDFASDSTWSDANSHRLVTVESTWNISNTGAGLANFYGGVIDGGSTSDNHVVGFESNITCNKSGIATCSSMEGFFDTPVINGSSTGTVTTRHGINIGGIALSGNMSVGTNEAIYIGPDTVGSSNWTIVSDKVAHSYFAGCIAISGVFDCNANGNGLTIGSSGQFTANSSGIITKYNNASTAGAGVAAILGATSQKAETGSADANVLTVTPASAAGTYNVCASISVASATSGVISWTASWKDSNSNTQTNIAMPIFQLGTAAPNTTFTTSAAGNYQGCSRIDVDNSGANIVVKWVGGGTSSAKMSATVERLQ